MVVQDNSIDDGRISVLHHNGESWSYVGNSRFVEYANSASPVRVHQNTDWQLHDIQVRGEEVCIVFLESELWPFVYCYRDDRWAELGGPTDSKRIGKHSQGGDLELLMPGCDCPELHDVYFVMSSMGQPHPFASVEGADINDQSDRKNYAGVWYYIDNDSLNPEKKWRPMGGSDPDNYLVNNVKRGGKYSRSSDGHLAISSIGHWGCHLHAVVSDESSNDFSDDASDRHLRFSRFSTADKTKFDTEGWKVLSSIKPSEGCYDSIHCDTAMPNRNDFVFANGVPAIAWVDSEKEFAYLSVWRDYTTVDESHTDQSGPTFTIAGYNQRMGGVPPMNEGRWSSKSPMYENPLAVTIDSHGPMVYMEITSGGSGKDWNGNGYGKKIYISAIDVTDPDAGWIEYAAQSNGWGVGQSNGNSLLPHPKPHELGLCGNEDQKAGSDLWQAANVYGGASHLRTTCSGDVMVAHVISKSSSPHATTMLAKNGAIDPDNQCSKRRLGSNGLFGGFFGW
jgi:hypothetical protein